MKTFNVCYEVRKIGAIGQWYHLSLTVKAEDQQEAFIKFHDLHFDRYEFRFPVYCYEVKE